MPLRRNEQELIGRFLDHANHGWSGSSGEAKVIRAAQRAEQVTIHRAVTVVSTPKSSQPLRHFPGSRYTKTLETSALRPRHRCFEADFFIVHEMNLNSTEANILSSRPASSLRQRNTYAVILKTLNKKACISKLVSGRHLAMVINRELRPACSNPQFNACFQNSAVGFFHSKVARTQSFFIYLSLL